VEGEVIVELKCVEALGNEHLGQCLNYLHALGSQVALLFNFQKLRLQLKRIVNRF
jgi:GxxExxY protein